MTEMLCRQCEQTFKGIACDTMGVCGKTPEVAALQDLLIYAAKAVAVYEKSLLAEGKKSETVDIKLLEWIFATLTNVNFDPSALAAMLEDTERVKNSQRVRLSDAGRKELNNKFGALLSWKPGMDVNTMIIQGKEIGLEKGITDPDLRSLREMLIFGLKGMSAYAHHAYCLGKTDQKVNTFLRETLAELANDDLSVDNLLELNLKCGEANLACLELLDSAHTDRFGHPEPTTVKLGVQKGPAIVVSGHDMTDLEQLLEQTKDTGINVFTHGEMLPGLAYPGLKKHTHLAGHYGSAWQNQQKEFIDIPAAILMTTNCIQEPGITYRDRIFTTGLVGWPDIPNIPRKPDGKKDFSAVINRVLELGGFKEDNIEKEITIGFAHNSVLSNAGKIVEGVKSGALKHFFLIGGCDGARPGRNYFTKFAERVPDDCLILTLGCGKNRMNRLNLGEVAGFPKLLDCGQCNDAYSAIVIARALADAFECGINDLPLSLIISWYEQKAVAVLLSLLYLGVKNIRLGPSLPAFITPNVLNVLVEKFNIQPITTVDEDLAAILNPGPPEKLEKSA